MAPAWVDTQVVAGLWSVPPWVVDGDRPDWWERYVWKLRGVAYHNAIARQLNTGGVGGTQSEDAVINSLNSMGI